MKIRNGFVSNSSSSSFIVNVKTGSADRWDLDAYLKDYGDKAIPLLEFLTKKEPLSEVIRSANDDLSIRIGSENLFKQLEDSSVVVSRYSVNGDNSGAISVIGPTRMDYESVISSMRYLSDLLGRLITSALEE